MPLSGRAVAIVEAMRQIATGDLAFGGGVDGRAISDTAMVKALRLASSDKTATFHGLGSTFRDWCGDRTEFRRDLPKPRLPCGERQGGGGIPPRDGDRETPGVDDRLGKNTSHDRRRLAAPAVTHPPRRRSADLPGMPLAPEQHRLPVQRRVGGTRHQPLCQISSLGLASRGRVFAIEQAKRARGSVRVTLLWVP